MIFRIYSKVAVKLADERYVFDRRELMLKDMIELETASGYSYGEWADELGRHSLRAMAALLHVLRKKNGVPSDFETMNFVVDDFDVVPLHEDGSEFTGVEILEDLNRRAKEAQAEDPTLAAVSGNGSDPATTSTSPSLRSDSTSAHGSGTGSPGTSSKGSKRKQTST